ncbi:MAG: hypothetical protein HYT87_12830 [Nitrospirae bacterium]|nr:hypothetical protein [Nitrospirota bacterium]
MAQRLYCDGSCLGNPGGPMGIGIVVVDRRPSRLSEISESYPEGTNNLAELLALHKAAEIAPRGSEIYTDSDWARGVVTLAWKVKSHAGLVSETRRLVMEKQLVVKRVPGHSGNTFNDRADFLAREAAESQKRAA